MTIKSRFSEFVKACNFQHREFSTNGLCFFALVKLKQEDIYTLAEKYLAIFNKDFFCIFKKKQFILVDLLAIKENCEEKTTGSKSFQRK